MEWRMNRLTRFVRWLYGDVEPEPTLEPEEYVLAVIERSLLREPEAWKLDGGKHRLYHEKADYSLWVSNGAYGLAGARGPNAWAALSAGGPHANLAEKWRKRLWAAAQPIAECRVMPKPDDVANQLEQILDGFDYDRHGNVVSISAPSCQDGPPLEATK